MEKAEFVKAAIEKYGDNFDFSLLPAVLANRRLVTVICNKHGKISIKPRDFLRSKYGCPRCSCEKLKHSSKDVVSRYIKKAKEKYGNKYDYSKVEYLTEPYSLKVITCPEHGEFKMSLRNHLCSKHGCPKCAIDFVGTSNIKYVDLSTYVDKLNTLFSNRYTYIAYDKTVGELTYLCPEHGEIRQRIHAHLAGMGCKRCAYDKQRITAEEFIERVKKVHPVGYTYLLDKPFTVNDKIQITHSCGNTYYGRVSNHLSGQGCVKCKTSSGEKRIHKYLDKLNLPHVVQYKVPGFPYRYDVYVPSLNMLIEYDGEQHFRPVKYFGGEAEYRTRIEKDAIKNTIAKMHRYHLVRIPYTEFKNLEKYLLRAIDGYFKYCVNHVFYKNFTSLCNALNLEKTTRLEDVAKYRTLNVLSLLNQ